MERKSTIKKYYIISFVFFIICCASCKKQNADIALLLKNASVNKSESALFEAASLAKSTDERLAVLKLSSTYNAETYSKVADYITKENAITEPVALAALDAYIASKNYSNAFLLFKSNLDPKLRAKEFCELVVLAYKSGMDVKLDIDSLVLCADASGDMSFLLYAALDCMESGDVEKAKTLLYDACNSHPDFIEKLPTRLLWDIGAFDLLSKREADAKNPLEIELCADACVMLGKFPEANAFYTYIIKNFPEWSWKPYAAIAWISELMPDPPKWDPSGAWPHNLPKESYEFKSSPYNIASYMYELVSKKFSGSTESMLNYARWLYVHGNITEAYNTVLKLSGKEASIARLIYGSQLKAVPLALRLVAEYPDAPDACDFALAVLASNFAWKEFKAVQNASEKLPMYRGWFWKVVTHVLAGENSEAIAIATKYSDTSYQAAFNAGILEAAVHQYYNSITNFETALNLTTEPEKKASAYIRIGDVYLATNKKEDAVAAYKSAVAVYPSSTEARTRLLANSKK